MGATQITSMSDAELLVLLCGPAGRALAKTPLLELFGFRKQRQGGLFAEEAQTPYLVSPQIAAAKELYIRAMQAEMQEAGIALTSPSAVRSFLCGRIGALEYETFWCLWVDIKSRLICAEELFRGTLTQTSVYPREVAKRALSHNAAAVILAHNHPSGSTEPSRADETLTGALKSALALIDVRVLDHFVVAGTEARSFAECGLL